MSAEAISTAHAMATMGPSVEAVRTAPNVLLLDFDDADKYAQFQLEWKPRLVRHFGPRVNFEEWASKSGLPHRHVKVTFGNARSLSMPERLLLQACCGSDPNREFLGLLNYWRGDPEPSVLFRPKVV